MTKKYTKTFDFGKVAYNGKNKKNAVCLDITLKIKDNKPVFSASGEVWNSRHSDIEMGGQCIDDIYNEFKGEIENRKQFESIMGLWERNHLNDMNAGCEHQRALKWDIDGYDKHPSEPCPKCGYKYGSAWIYEPITKKDLREIVSLLNVPLHEQNSIIKMGV